KIFQAESEHQRGLVVLVTSMHPRAGVTQITRAMAESLDQQGNQFSILLNARGRGRNHVVVSANESWRPTAEDPHCDNWQSLQSHLASYFDQLRHEYRYVLIDCPSLKDSQDAVMLSPLVDGIVLVVEANRTQTDQLLYAERIIEAAQGRLLGHILN